MTINELKAAIPKLQALADGKVIEEFSDGRWGTLYASSFGVVANAIIGRNQARTRIKPEPKYRPWTMEEVPVGKVVKSKATGYRVLILSAQPSSTTLTIGRGTPHAELFEHWTMDDGSVCGVAVGE